MSFQLQLKSARGVLYAGPINYFGGIVMLITWVGMLFVFTPFFVLALMIIFTGNK
jgi:hypothetical protein